MKCTLVKFTLLAAFESHHFDQLSLGGADTVFETLGDAAADILRDNGALTVASEYDHVEVDLPKDEDSDELVEALVKHFPNVPADLAFKLLLPKADANTNEWAEDRCRVCDTLIGMGWRVMHVGICDECAKEPRH